MPKSEYILTPHEIEIVQKGMEDPDYITGYFLRPVDAELGWYFDYNFEAEGRWQKLMHSAEQSLITVIGGVGTGKTLGVGMSAVVWSLTTEDFKFMNVAQKEWQARIMYDLILDRARDTPLERIIWSAPQRPYPKIILRFRIGRRLYQSTLEFMSVDRDAKGIFSWRGDWINIDEAGLLDNLDEVAKNLATRLTGSTGRGRAFIGRLSITSNPWDTPHLWYMFDLATADPENNLSIVVSTRHNKNVTEDQIKNLLKHIPEDERAKFLDGLRPEGKGNYFAKTSIYKCESVYQEQLISEAVSNNKPGFVLHTLYGAGITEFHIPPQPGRIYFLLGDPGSGEAPLRNAPVCMVWDVTDFPSSAMSMTAFWWGSGFGQISPFVEKLLDLKRKYNPAFVGMDSTGTQKNMAELLNVQYFNPDDPHRMGEDGIIGLDFSGPKKPAYLVAAKLILEAELSIWPKFVIGMRAQLSNYDPTKDRAGLAKIPQDIVATYAMSCFAARAYFSVSLDDYLYPNIDKVLSNESYSDGRDARLTNSERSKRSQRENSNPIVKQIPTLR